MVVRGADGCLRIRLDRGSARILHEQFEVPAGGGGAVWVVSVSNDVGPRPAA
jgi:hypothetical protein